MAQPYFEQGHEAQRRASEITAHPTENWRLDNDRDLARMGGWLIASAVFAFALGLMMVAGGWVPGLMALGLGLVLGVWGVVTLGLVAHHNG